MPAILYGFLSIWRRYFPTVAALLTLASIIGVACNVAAEEPKHIRITLARSVSAIPLWASDHLRKKLAFGSSTFQPVQMQTCSAICRAASSSAHWAIKARRSWPSRTSPTSRSAGTPRPIVELLQKEISTIVRMPDVAARLLEFGVIPEGDSSADFAAYIENEITKWKRVIEV